MRKGGRTEGEKRERGSKKGGEMGRKGRETVKEDESGEGNGRLRKFDLIAQLYTVALAWAIPSKMSDDKIMES